MIHQLKFTQAFQRTEQNSSSIEHEIKLVQQQRKADKYKNSTISKSINPLGRTLDCLQSIYLDFFYLHFFSILVEILFPALEDNDTNSMWKNMTKRIHLPTCIYFGTFWYHWYRYWEKPRISIPLRSRYTSNRLKEQLVR